MARSGWIFPVIEKTFPRSMRWMGLTKVPILKRLIEYMFFEGDHLIVLPRNEVVEVNRDVDDPGQMALPTELVDQLIDSMEYHFVMDFCLCRISMPCEDYPRDLGCIFMGEAARGINPKWGRSVSKDEAKEHIRKCQEAGLIHAVGKSKLDTVWLGIGPGEKLLTICNCCPCCCITRVIPHTHEVFQEKLVRAPGVEVMVNQEECVGCGTCVSKACILEAISLVDGKAVINQANCRGCGRCAEACPTKAITLTIDGSLFVRESVRQIGAVVSFESEQAAASG
ncbi:4Fe-4S binding domain-containing protein [Desulfatibacillum alkenivorans DSM 16219]|uniref:4Fe-4S binding domain-containing protein n=1 Tax=Desulfatibacillum alkenivorans DSM 16219 TaxID=1121393 RepID=A0A1M6L9D7_9BACT|nr:4Fe-4S binding protein [Desulfatibacillum alkenivorans]SHJ67838.1 4Fe-4S binding domain-containing protein [Desulfatibacillum alkenivorans DSM 16219]